MNKNKIIVCDWVSDNGLSGLIKFNHNFDHVALQIMNLNH